MPYSRAAVSTFSGVAGPTGATGPQGPPSGWTLASDASAGATSVTINVNATVPLAVGDFILIDSYTSQAELRKLTSVSSATLGFSPALTYAHVTGDTVISVNQSVLTTGHWGCKADGSDEHDALQEAIYQTAVNGSGFWLDGQNRSYHQIGQPLVIPTQAKLRGLNIRALTTFSPIAANNAMLMTQSGNIKPFTADPSTDTITCTAHGIPGDNIGVVFSGSALPGGLTAGTFYYAINRTTDTFQVSTTSGGSAVDITSAGSGGTAWCEVYAANAKCQFDNCYFVGQVTTTANLNGLLMSVQQPGYANSLRVDNFDGTAIRMKGQQYIFYNLEMIQNRTALTLDNMSFLWVYGMNAEQTNQAVYVDTGGAINCAFYGIHFELHGGIYGISSEIGFYFDNGALSMTIDGAIVGGSSTATFLKSDAASSGNTSYALRNIYWSGGQASAGQVMVNDVNRGISLDQWTDCQGELTQLLVHRLPSSQSFDDPFPMGWIGAAGRYVSIGSQNDDQVTLRMAPGSTQTADQLRVLDSSGNRMGGFNKAGVFFTERNTAPADGDLVAGEMTLWLDDTNGACKLMVKAKQADGTVRTGSVSLA